MDLLGAIFRAGLRAQGAGDPPPVRQALRELAIEVRPHLLLKDDETAEAQEVITRVSDRLEEIVGKRHSSTTDRAADLPFVDLKSLVRWTSRVRDSDGLWERQREASAAHELQLAEFRRLNAKWKETRADADHELMRAAGEALVHTRKRVIDADERHEAAIFFGADIAVE